MGRQVLEIDPWFGGGFPRLGFSSGLGRNGGRFARGNRRGLVFEDLGAADLAGAGILVLVLILVAVIVVVVVLHLVVRIDLHHLFGDLVVDHDLHLGEAGAFQGFLQFAGDAGEGAIERDDDQLAVDLLVDPGLAEPAAGDVAVFLLHLLEEGGLFLDLVEEDHRRAVIADADAAVHRLRRLGLPQHLLDFGFIDFRRRWLGHSSPLLVTLPRHDGRVPIDAMLTQPRSRLL